MVRADSHQLRTVAGDSEGAEAIRVVARAHKTLIWERTRHTLRLRHALREFFPAALVAFTDLTGADALELLAKAADPASAARLTITHISAALTVPAAVTSPRRQRRFRLRCAPSTLVSRWSSPLPMLRPCGPRWRS
jgi:hypothetical protein